MSVEPNLLPVQHQIHEDGIEDVPPPLVHRLSPGKTALFRAIARTVQVLEDRIWARYANTPLDLAKGDALEFWGWLAGVPRQGLDTYWWRRLIRVSFLARNCNGTIPQILNLWAEACAVEPEYVEFTRYTKGVVILTAWRTDWMPEDYARRAGEVVKRACGLRPPVLLEAQIPWMGERAERTRPPYPADTPIAFGAKDW